MINNFKYLKGIVKPTYITINNVGMGPQLRLYPHPPIIESTRESGFLFNFPTEFNIPCYYVENVSGLSCRRQTQNDIMVWDDLIVKLVDPVNPSLSQRLIDLVTGTIYRRFEMTMQKLDPVGIVTSEWRIYGFVSNIHFGELDYMSDELCSLTMTISVDNANLIL